jgi:hypothetical protein
MPAQEQVLKAKVSSYLRFLLLLFLSICLPSRLSNVHKCAAS